MTRLTKENDVRVEFKNFDDAVLLGVDEVRQLIGAKSAGSVYAALYRHDLPEPIIRKNRQLRWSVKQMREHLQEIEDDFKKRQIEEVGVHRPKRAGRSRIEARPF